MTREERIQTIGQLLAKGVTLLLLREAEEKRRGNSSPGGPGQNNPSMPKDSPNGNGEPISALTDDTDRAIVAYLERVGKASPRDMLNYLEMSKATLFRRHNRLVQARVLERTGSTTAIRYRLAGKDGRSPATRNSDLVQGEGITQ